MVAGAVAAVRRSSRAPGSSPAPAVAGGGAVAGSSSEVAERTRRTRMVNARRNAAGAASRAACRRSITTPRRPRPRARAAAPAPAARRQSSPSASRPAYMTDRDAATSALASPLVKARATSAGVAPCAPTPGSRRIDCGISRLASPTAADGSPRRPRRRSRARARRRAPRPTPHERRHLRHKGRPSERIRSWTSAPPALDVFTRQKIPALVRRHA